MVILLQNRNNHIGITGRIMIEIENVLLVETYCSTEYRMKSVTDYSADD